MDDFFEIRVEFWISGDFFQFDDATKAVGIEPTSTRNREDFRVQEYAQTEWAFTYGAERSYLVENQIQPLQALLEPRAEAIRQFCAQHDLVTGLTITIYRISEQQPAAELSREFVRLASHLNAKINIFTVDCTEADD